MLVFSEQVDPRHSGARVVDTLGRPVPGVTPARAAPGRPAELLLQVTHTLPKGVYTVDWHTVSAVDGHAAAGSFAFGVGVAGVPATPPPATAAAPAWTGWAAGAGRWLLDAGLLLLAGGAAIVLCVFGGRLPARGVLLLAAAAVLALAGMAVLTVAERAVLGAGSLGALYGSDFGRRLALESGAVALCCLGAAAAALRPGRRVLALLGALAAAALLAHVWAGHAGAASPFRPANLAVQWLHVLAVAVWLGGLAWLLLGIAGRQPAAGAAAVRRFSNVAGVALAVVVVTGVWRAVAETGGLRALVDTNYGRLLLAKLALVAVLVGLGALNRYRYVPAVGGSAQAARGFGRAARAELLLAAAVLAVTASLSGAAPAVSAAAAARLGVRPVLVSAVDYTGTVRVRLAVTPAQAGFNVYDLRLAAAAGKPLAAVRRVRLEFLLPGQNAVGPATVVLRRGPRGSWQGQGLQLSVVGAWKVFVVIGAPATATVVPLRLPVGPAPGG